ncbi:hypothetical protein OTU49_010967 [Cherax quadricarinatus]|uniref:Uncharacterized protein n=1 Tax=Cherax quadricarinatus TaxID=27406 RepID=A0AAW0W6J2_CHEQU
MFSGKTTKHTALQQANTKTPLEQQTITGLKIVLSIYSAKQNNGTHKCNLRETECTNISNRTKIYKQKPDITEIVHRINKIKQSTDNIPTKDKPKSQTNSDTTHK